MSLLQTEGTSKGRPLHQYYDHVNVGAFFAGFTFGIGLERDKVGEALNDWNQKGLLSDDETAHIANYYVHQFAENVAHQDPEYCRLNSAALESLGERDIDDDLGEEQEAIRAAWFGADARWSEVYAQACADTAEWHDLFRKVLELEKQSADVFEILRESGRVRHCHRNQSTNWIAYPDAEGVTV